MQKIILPCLPEAQPKTNWKAIWVNPETQDKVKAISDASGISMYRLTDYIVNLGLQLIELQATPENE